MSILAFYSISKCLSIRVEGTTTQTLEVSNTQIEDYFDAYKSYGHLIQTSSYKDKPILVSQFSHYDELPQVLLNRLPAFNTLICMHLH